ncbi:MAG: hypothetical protein GX580_11740 [Candidatus Hydrogenedens sp.]|nr:hypothetical protein [Candidatus Hydrogenedentota bacterium]NLF58298.1 hypothetical protein [Candidatus Hydrogenedens sp.]
MGRGRRQGPAWAALLLLLPLAAMPHMAVSQSPNPAPDITEHYTRMMKYHVYMDGSVPAGAVLFVGDSITQGLCVAAVCDRGVNYGIGSDTTVGVLERLPKYGSIDRARAVVVAIGVNDLSRRDNDAILENYRKIAGTVAGSGMVAGRAPLVFSAVLPVDERVNPENAGVNGRIRELNRGLAKVCAETRGCRMVDVTGALADDTGSLAPENHVGDGVHLSDKGYTLWITALRDALREIPEKAGADTP